MHYQHLSQAERYQIFILLKAGHPVSFIATQLQRHPSSIYRELKRNLVFDPRHPGYSPSRAHQQARWRVLKHTHRKRLSAHTWQQVRQRLLLRHSPQQISGALRRLGVLISHESIYRYIWKDRQQGGQLWRYLRGKLLRGRRYRRYAQRGQRGVIANRVGIEQRCAAANARSRLGDFEIDTVFGRAHKAPLLSIVDRRSRYVLLQPLASKHASGVAEALIAALAPLPRGKRRSLTSDNGKEFSAHERVSRALQLPFYFARPYASWQRGTNENTNGLLRQYFPKQLDFQTITPAQLQHAVNELNHRPRKVLGFKTPHEVFFA